MTELLDRWCHDIQALTDRTVQVALARETGRDLLRRWSQPQRHYHTPQHLTEVLAALDDLERVDELTGADGATARVAAWYHDAVYRIGRSDNEVESAELAREQLTHLGLDETVVGLVARIVLATVDHHPGDDSGDPQPGAGGRSAAMLGVIDADLWILSADPDRFDEYCRQVRAEFRAVPHDRYAQARAGILHEFLDRPRLYATDWAQEQWSAAARANLLREVTRLAAR